MSRLKLSEYKAKSILLGDKYHGVQLRSGEKWQFPAGQWVAKVDQGVKKRMKQGLVVINKPAAEMEAKMHEWEGKGFTQFVLEPLLSHEQSEEQYLSLERVREGVRVLHAAGGGIDIEAHPEQVGMSVIRGESDVATIADKTKLPQEFLASLYEHFNKDFFAFLEINPFVVQNGAVHLLDAAALVDSAGEFFTSVWRNEDIVRGKAKHQAEEHVDTLAATTPASLKLSVINPDGAIFLLLSGGGGSIVIADEAQLEGVGSAIGNYGEYSGGPTREETYLYAKEIIQLLLASKAPRKALVIAGGVANFTDVKKTFAGIIDALTEQSDALRAAGVKVFVRRGGPNEAAGLALMKAFLEKEQLLGSIVGSETIITHAIDEAIKFIK